MSASKVTVGAGALIVSDAAEKFMRRMTRFGGQGPDAGFRLAVKPGGCSGLSSEFTVEREPLPGDETVSVNGLRVFVSRESVPLLAGQTMDFADTPTQSGFTFFGAQPASSCSDSAKPSMVQIAPLQGGSA
jgi:iron-sulfur cluster assembly accessory protein